MFLIMLRWISKPDCERLQLPDGGGLDRRACRLVNSFGHRERSFACSKRRGPSTGAMVLRSNHQGADLVAAARGGIDRQVYRLLGLRWTEPGNGSTRGRRFGMINAPMAGGSQLRTQQRCLRDGHDAGRFA